MENSFALQKFGYQDHAHKKSKSQLHESTIQGKDINTVHNEIPHKSIWQSINIFSKIRKLSKSKIKESAINVKQTNPIIQKEFRPCQSKGMDKEHTSEDNLNNGLEDDSASVASKNSFFGKMNLENLLKIFIDLHKKKQSQSRQNTNGIMKEQQTANLDCILKVDQSQTDFSCSQVLLKSNVTSNPLMLPDCSESPLLFTEILQNPVNSLSLINTSFEKNNVLRITAKEDTVCNVDSTLSLLNNVSIKLENYLSEAKNNDIKTPQTYSHEQTESVSTENSDVKVEEKPSTDLTTQSDIKRKQDIPLTELNFDSQSFTSIVENQTFDNDETEDKKLAYTIVESDIKRMIKELLQESNNLKNSIVATGIQEELPSSFTEISKSFDSFIICRSICNDLLNDVSNRHISSIKTRKHLNVSFKRDAEEEADYILTSLLENVLSSISTPKHQVQINYCLIQSNCKSNTKKQELDHKTRKFRESNIYILTKKLYKTEAPVKKIIHPPKVTVRNLSTSKRIRFASSENSLTSRIRRSAALLMTLYDEMRDYSYYNCTSNILCDLYESMIKQGLISLTNLRQHKSIENIVLRHAQSAVASGSNDNQSPPTSTLPPQSLTDSDTDPRSSSGNSSNIADVRISLSSDSSSSEGDDVHIPRRTILPNLKYTYQSDQEINTPEEVKVIDENVAKNGVCSDVNIREFPISEESMNIEYEIVSINESEAFIKEL